MEGGEGVEGRGAGQGLDGYSDGRKVEDGLLGPFRVASSIGGRLGQRHNLPHQAGGPWTGHWGHSCSSTYVFPWPENANGERGNPPFGRSANWRNLQVHRMASQEATTINVPPVKWPIPPPIE